jgi:hypothetical protein
MHGFDHQGSIGGVSIVDPASNPSADGQRGWTRAKADLGETANPEHPDRYRRRSGGDGQPSRESERTSPQAAWRGRSYGRDGLPKTDRSQPLIRLTPGPDQGVDGVDANEVDQHAPC